MDGMHASKTVCIHEAIDPPCHAETAASTARALAAIAGRPDLLHHLAHRHGPPSAQDREDLRVLPPCQRVAACTSAPAGLVPLVFLASTISEEAPSRPQRCRTRRGPAIINFRTNSVQACHRSGSLLSLLHAKARARGSHGDSGTRPLLSPPRCCHYQSPAMLLERVDRSRFRCTRVAASRRRRGLLLVVSVLNVMTTCWGGLAF